MDAAKRSCDERRARLVAKIQAAKKVDPRLAAEYLQAIGRGTQIQSILEMDNDSLLLYNHISPHRGASGVWQTRLSAAVRDTVTSQHAEIWSRVVYVREGVHRSV